jgi:hypothetical protein
MQDRREPRVSKSAGEADALDARRERSEGVQRHESPVLRRDSAMRQVSALRNYRTWEDRTRDEAEGATDHVPGDLLSTLLPRPDARLLNCI